MLLSQAIALSEENENEDDKKKHLSQAIALALEDWNFLLIFAASRWNIFQETIKTLFSADRPLTCPSWPG